MKISLIGTGRVASYLFPKLLTAGIEVKQVVATDVNKALNLTKGSPAQALVDVDLLKNEVDLVLVCVQDDYIAHVSSQIPEGDYLVAHTSGAQSLNKLHHKNRRGIFYPLMSLRQHSTVDIEKIPFCVEAEASSDLKLLEEFAHILGAKAHEMDSTQRAVLHMGAVFSQNFTNHLIARAQNFMEENHISFNLLFPLLQQSIDNLKEDKAFDLQTGPAIRQDEQTINRHLSLLKHNTDIEIYKLLTQSIQQTHNG